MPDLTFTMAQSLATALTTIGHPYAQAAVNATALDLMTWCKGVFWEGRIVMNPEAQAQALVNHVRLNWDGWPEQGGTKQLYEEFVRMFSPAAAAGENIWQASPPPACEACGDTGWKTVTKGAYEYAVSCKECGGRRKPAAVCSRCYGKETLLLADGRRQPCDQCLSPERRRQVGEWLKQRREAI